MTAPVSIIGCGMTTAIGLSAPAACAALRARLDNFRETRFISRNGAWVLGAEVPLEQPWRGLARLLHLLVGPLRECLDACDGIPSSAIPLFLCVAEPERAGRIAGLDDRLPRELVRALGSSFHAASGLVAYGQAGGAVALDRARRLVANGAAPRAIVAGVDSLLLAETLRAYDAEDRLLSEANSNGFIPGEAGAAVLVGPPERRGLRLLGVGLAAEKARLGSDLPLRAEGLVAAMRQGLGEAGLDFSQVSYRIADLGGEQYYFKEAALAAARLLRGPNDVPDLWHPADGFGYTGAAAIPLMLGVSLTAGRKSYAPGPVVLAQASHDDGRRAAMVLRMEA
jgi:3-oxoacyl-[acyl-carrier-protein] synthase I